MGGIEIDFPGCPRLDDLPLVHDGHDVRQSQGLDPIMGHIDRGDLKVGQKRPQFFAGFFPEFCIQVGERFIEKDDLGLSHQRPGQGHTLLLPAGKLGRRPPLEPFQLHEAQRLFDLAADDVFGQFAGLERVGHVVEDVHVGPDGVGLKHHPEAPVLRGNEDVLRARPDNFATDFDFPAVR